MIQQRVLMSKIRDWLILTVALMFAGAIVPGITYNNLLWLFIVAIVLSIFNIILRPILLFMSLPFLVASFGLGIVFILWFINSILLYFSSSILGNHFRIDNFFSAMIGALVVSFFTFSLNIIFGIKPKPIIPKSSPQSKKNKRENLNDDNVIDI